MGILNKLEKYLTEQLREETKAIPGFKLQKIKCCENCRFGDEDYEVVEIYCKNKINLNAVQKALYNKTKEWNRWEKEIKKILVERIGICPQYKR